jgi:transcriptional regulator with XRE-family HTH domain
MKWSDLAKKAGMSKSTLSEIKNGQKRVLKNPEHERKLAEALGVTIAELYTEKINW